MNKRILGRATTIIAIIAMFFICVTAYAYDGKGYSIDIPSTFKKSGNDNWEKANGTSVNIQITSNDNASSAKQSTLDDIIKELEKKYPSIEVESSEITTITEKNYKCMRITSKHMGVYIEQYSIPSKDNVYTITIGSFDKDYLSSDEAKNRIKSLKIDNNKNPEPSSNTATKIAITLTIVIVIVATAIITMIIIKRKK